MTKVLHMIGHSHIDPVWFWPREEGMQEVCATLASALDRLEEYPDTHVSCTSAAFFDYVSRARPDMMPRLRRAVKAGRLEIIGGWWVEPDCLLPCGESLIRHGLYGQRTLRRLLGVSARIGANVDSFGHDAALPQILRGCGMDRYVFMRPSFTRHPRAYLTRPAPHVHWESQDGSRVEALSLPAEYTCWFEHSLRENIELTLGVMQDGQELPCFYGVGNHGGGPTKANIESVRRLRAEYPQAELRFSTLEAAFDAARDVERPLLRGSLEYLNPGCFSVDHVFKQEHRRAEQALLRAERLSSMAAAAGQEQPGAEVFAALWKRLMFCQFHDTISGTAIREARDNAVRDMAGVTAEAEAIQQLAVQRLAATLDTRGEGHPVLLINDTDEDFDGIADVELCWFCKDPLTLVDDGREVGYQRAKQSCTMRWYNLGGRRRVLFPVKVPALGMKVLRALPQEPTPLPNLPAREERVLENGRIRLEVDEAGRICSLLDKPTGYQALTGPVELRLFADQGDSWGKRQNGWTLLEERPGLRCTEVMRTADGPIRQTLRIRMQGDCGQARWLIHLDGEDPFVQVELQVLWLAPWHRLKLSLPVGCAVTRAEAPLGESRRPVSAEECYMHRYVDALRPDGSGLLCVNDGVYAFDTPADRLDVTLLRSAIYAHSNCVDWFDERDTYDHCDLGEHRYRFLLAPHGGALTVRERRALAQRLCAPLTMLGEMQHPGTDVPQGLRLLGGSVRLDAFKPAEDGGLAVRLREVEGSACVCCVSLHDREKELAFGPYQSRTLCFRGGEWLETNMLEDVTHEP